MSDKLNKHISKDRKDFEKGFLNEGNIQHNPYILFKKWLQEALDKMAMEPYAFHLGTTSQNKPTIRVVYLRTIEENGYVFFTNYKGRKGKEIEQNNAVVMNFFWAEMERQVRIEGNATKISPEASDAYFESRPRESQLGAWASNQSEEIENYHVLVEKLNYFEKKFQGKKVPRPEHWGGYLIKPNYFEFWQGRPSRLHDRIIFSQEKEKWKVKRINP